MSFLASMSAATDDIQPFTVELAADSAASEGALGPPPAELAEDLAFLERLRRIAERAPRVELSNMITECEGLLRHARSASPLAVSSLIGLKAQSFIDETSVYEAWLEAAGYLQAFGLQPAVPARFIAAELADERGFGPVTKSYLRAFRSVDRG